MNADLKQLIRLQAIDLSIQEIQTRVDKFSGISKALDEKLKSALAGVESAKEKIKSNLANRKKFEVEVGVVEAKISKYREQMLGVKSNVEYKGLQHEIEYAQNSIRKTEDEILNMMGDFETLQVSVKTAEAQLKQDQQLVTDERRELEKVHNQDVSAMESYLKERQDIAKTITEDVLVRYDRVCKARGGIAVSKAIDYLCEICQVRMRPQVFQEIRKNEQLITCDACSRILYYPENMDHPFEIA